MVAIHRKAFLPIDGLIRNHLTVDRYGSPHQKQALLFQPLKEFFPQIDTGIDGFTIGIRLIYIQNNEHTGEMISVQMILCQRSDVFQQFCAAFFILLYIGKGKFFGIEPAVDAVLCIADQRIHSILLVDTCFHTGCLMNRNFGKHVQFVCVDLLEGAKGSQ